MEPEIVVYYFTGDGTAILPGVPARNLTADDVAALPAWLQEALETSPLYTTEAPAEPGEGE